MIPLKTLPYGLQFLWQAVDENAAPQKFVVNLGYQIQHKRGYCIRIVSGVMRDCGWAVSASHYKKNLLPPSVFVHRRHQVALSPAGICSIERDHSVARSGKQRP